MVEGFLALLCGGGREADDRWLAMLKEVVRRSPGSVLVRSGPVGGFAGRVLVVQSRRADDPVGLITPAAVWLGPLSRRDQLQAVRTWLSAGGLACARLPAVLRPLRLVPVPLAVASPN